MDRAKSPSSTEFSSLPVGCPELRQTAIPGCDQPVEQHLDAIPALDQTGFDRLVEVASPSQHGDSDTVLGVADLLRRRQDGSHALHPRVIQVLPLGDVDPTLTCLADRVEEHVSYRAYQYLDYLVEYHDDTRDFAAIHPSGYSIYAIDLIRDLRANNVLTSIRQWGRSYHSYSTLENVVEKLEREGEIIEGVATLAWIDDEKSSELPSVIVEDRRPSIGRRSPDEIIGLCETLKHRFLAPVTICSATKLAMDD